VIATAAGETITLAGPPGKATGIVRLEYAERVVPIALTLAGGVAVFTAHVRPFAGPAIELRLRLPREMPPGVYEGEASFGGRMRGVVVRVEPAPQVRIQPKRTTIPAEPGAHAEFRVLIANAGNVPVDVPKADTFDLDDAEGQDRALGAALRAILRPDERRVDRFFEEIRERHGGQARISVQAGAGAIEPGAARDVTCMIAVPDTVQAGRSYLGAWQLANAAHIVVIEVKPALAIKGRALT
jgi:hypothetical protein